MPKFGIAPFSHYRAVFGRLASPSRVNRGHFDPVIFCGLGSYAKPHSSDDEASNTISGTVTNSVTHEPIGRARVYTADECSATFTDDHGNFELTVPEVKQQPGGGGAPIKSPVQLQAKKPGYLTDYGIDSSAMIGGALKM